MNRLLKRQLKRYFGESFDISLMPENFSEFIEDVSSSYDDFYEEKKFLEHTIDINSQDIEKANIKIKEQNIHLQKLLEETSDENEEMIYMLKQYKEAIDTSLIVSTTDTHGIIRYVNDNFVQISGYSQEELIGRPHNIVRHPDTPELIFEDMWKTILDKKVWQGIIQNKKKNGSTYYVNAVVVPLLNRNGDIVEFMALREDITAAIEYQNKLESQKQRVSVILDNQESIIVLFDEKDGVIEVNRKFYEVFGFNSFAEFKEKHKCICELFEERENFLKSSTDEKLWVIPILEESQKVHLAMINKRVYSVKVAIIDIENKKTYLATFTDITEIEEARIKSQEAEREKANFLANMSHEIRTPMNSILGFSELLSKTQLDPKQSKYTKLIKSSTATLIQIINDILDFSKLESGQSEIEISNVNPFMEFEDTLMLLAEKAREKNLSYIIDIDSALPECIGIDSFHIKQILINLIGNAIKFTHEHGTIYIKIESIVTKDEKKVRFIVQDSGIGIPKDRQDKIFEPFSQADSSTTRKFGGTGLGLSISSSLSKLMGSRLQLESEEGKGSKFYFDISYIDCAANSTLKEHLNDFKVYVYNMNETLLKYLSTQLNSYKVDYIVIDDFDKKLDIPNSVIISKDEKFSKKFKKARILLLTKADKCVENSRCQHIEIFDDFPSILYNELMRLKLIDTDVQKSKDYNNINLKILIAEDYEINRILVSELLGQFENIEYAFALNGQEAVDMAIKNKYDLILMDINMPIMNGMDATRILVNEFNIQTPIVALTANALEGDKEKFLSAGMADYLTKPIDIKAFETILLKYSNKISKETKVALKIESKEGTKENNEMLDIGLSLKMAEKKMGLAQNIIEKLFKSYASSLEKIVTNLENAIDKKDFGVILINAHNLKSGAASLCFEKVITIAQEIESNAKNKNEDFDFLQRLENLKPYLETIREYK
ncbi:MULTISPECIES: ATP-binding protein [unclassified Sulfurimonas]|uniref:ATP-binding protein n=1 Tax=unclassified Sulfurimonas TaxID=2623549 RepID=UPI0025E7667E|nr:MULTISPECIES: ATP-binding protein [unclassified Sulfurimonas]